jgi:uncharacterized membrane protein YeaQ/YmgE (transglycosylase-associated protein family)
MPDLSPETQVWFNTVLIWIGFASVAGILAQALLPKGKPEGLYGVLVIGACGSCVGCFGVDWLANFAAGTEELKEFAEINPIGPVGLFVSVISALCVLIFYRVVLFVFGKKKQ